MTITDWPPTRSERKTVDPVSLPLRVALDTARAEAKAAWDTFEAERIRIAGDETIDLTKDTETLQTFDDLHKSYLAKADVVEELTRRWEASLSRNGHEPEPAGKGGKGYGKVARSVLDKLDQKALIQPAGAVVAPDLIDLIVDTALRDRSILPLLTTSATAGDEVRYFAQVAETLNVDAVAPGDVKPTTVETVEARSAPVRTLATVSEGIPRQLLADFAALGAWLETRFRAGVELELETQVISGDGTGQNFRGILQTTGINSIPAPAAGENAADQIAKGIAAVEADGITPSAVALNSADFWTMRVVRESGTSGTYLFGDPAESGGASIWGIPLIRSNGVPVGTGLVGDFSEAHLIVRETTTIQWADSHSDQFIRNLVTMRCEMRAAMFVGRPSAFASVDLAA